jgi:predicted RNA-binding protein YlqC (UPF0109 family)
MDEGIPKPADLVFEQPDFSSAGNEDPLGRGVGDGQGDDEGDAEDSVDIDDDADFEDDELEDDELEDDELEDDETEDDGLEDDETEDGAADESDAGPDGLRGRFDSAHGYDDLERDSSSSGGDSGNEALGGRALAVLDHVVRSIVDDPDAVAIDVEEGRQGLRLSVHVGPGDMGRVIGRRGRVAQAVRTLVKATAARDGTDATVDIVD